MAKAWDAISELDFVTDFFTWLFMALSRLAEPLMTLSSLYVIVQTGVTALHSDTLYNAAIACMLGAPEIILPGAFVLAGKEHARNKAASRILYTCAFLFVLLTLATLADLFIWHLTGQSLNVLMFARCAVSVGYSIVFRVIIHVDHTPISGQLEDTPVDAKVNTLEDSEEDTFVDTLEDTTEDTLVDTDEHEIVDIQEYKKVSTKVSPKQSTKVSTNNARGAAQQKALRTLKNNPGIGPSELAKKAGISRSYANKILADAK